ncbi:hypothetical protein CYLTODRAFT_376918 [Cylindrobasidium torrendii FP15055 ss-10]|uniref:Uncharacterized protein n=1 Tax=Cylindrobasidium torrendii FP15055 ss-10 TaxID=1314674 RepID=A0A0D7B9W4_9AGAR|nr:hypothetical protein CYLTODRAFT_376918 [Cylindrobasidium torrendii FP15055 ss-10]
MDTTSVAFAGAETETKTVCDLEDWFDLKDLFAKAAEQYENHSALEALPYIRGVVHECHSFLNLYQDPSVLFIGQRHDEVPHDLYDWEGAHRPKCTCIELPTAFHSILGTALFMFGNLIDKDATLALPGEPATPIPYWLGALDVFETGENLPSRVYGTGCDAPEDWRMAIIWGRTLVAIADANVSQGSGEDCSAIFTLDEPNWPSESPFAAIALRRPPLTRRMTLASASSNDIMVLAMDQFSRGIFHMPQFSPGATSTLAQPFSRANELFNIASEVLALAQKMRSPTEQVFWALWADSVLNQMKMEGADGEHWRGTINRSRAECWLIAGSVHAEHIENQMEEGDSTVLETAMARQARTSLEKAIGFFEKSGVEEIAMAEALLSLANITPEGSAKEALYRRVELLGIDLESMDVD